MSLLQQGFLLMLVGMGTVFAFLTLLVAAMHVMARALAWLPAPAADGRAAREDEAATMAAIAAAIHRHRNGNGSS